MMYFGVLAVGVLGALIARFGARGMSRAMGAMAIAQIVAGGVALAAFPDPASPPLEIIGLTAMFAVMFLAAAWLFRRAASAA